jgi:hypothetical protein
VRLASCWPSASLFSARCSGRVELLGEWAAENGFVSILEASLLIGGWVAMWRPIEIFLYDWPPIRADAHRFDRLAAVPVRIAGN